MKKYIIAGCIWFLAATVVMTCKARSSVEYRIWYDSNTKETYEIKNRLQEIYADLVSGVHKESYILMVLHNKDRFAFQDNIKVEWRNNELEITEGDGRGDMITGSLQAVSVCVPEVQPRSLLQELFD